MIVLFPNIATRATTPTAAKMTTDSTLAATADAKLAISGGDNKLTKEQQLALINVNLAEVLNPEIIEKVIDEGRAPRIYWGKYDSTICQ